jgi:hypothetical protein
MTAEISMKARWWRERRKVLASTRLLMIFTRERGVMTKNTEQAVFF